MGRTFQRSLLCVALALVLGVDRSWAQPATVTSVSVVSVLKVEVRAITKIVVFEDSADAEGFPIVRVISNLGTSSRRNDRRLRPELLLMPVEEWPGARGKGGEGDALPETVLVARYSTTPP
jgi:hypothetical protein